MARVLLLLIIAFLVWLGVRLLRGDRDRQPGGSVAVGAAAPPRAPDVIEQCAWCGVHAPLASAVSLPDGRVYCSDAHRDQARIASAAPARPASDS